GGGNPEVAYFSTVNLKMETADPKGRGGDRITLGALDTEIFGVHPDLAAEEEALGVADGFDREHVTVLGSGLGAIHQLEVIIFGHQSAAVPVFDRGLVALRLKQGLEHMLAQHSR